MATPSLLKIIPACALALLLQACGGGGDEGPATPLQLGVAVAGQPAMPIAAGEPVTVTMLAGQSVQLEANEPVQWAFSVNGSPLFTSGATVFIQGVTILQGDLSPSRVVLRTTLDGPTQLPIYVTLTATSTIDLVQVATVTLVLQ